MAGKGIWRTEREIHKRTGISSTRFRQKNENGSGHVRLYYRSSTVYRV